MPEVTEQRTKLPRTWLPMVLWTAGILLVLGLAWGLYSFGTDRGRFGLAVRRIRVHPERWGGKQAGMDTLESCGVSSKHIATTVDSAYRDLSLAFSVPPRTYFSEGIDCPTQETIWQFQNYFVRLYVTSALECDAAMVGVHEGTYEQFRAAELGPKAHPRMRFVQIDYRSPKRFLYPNR